MPRRLYLLRHAKSSWDDAGRSDHARPLTRRGQRACLELARHLRSSADRPHLVLCSSAVRARETLDGIRDALPEDVEVVVEHELYGASTPALLDRLRELSDHAASVMMIGHNPGIGELATALAGDGDDDALARLRRGYPTGGLAHLTFDARWRELAPGAAALEAFVLPRELEDG